MKITSKLLLSTTAFMLAGAMPATGAWQPQKPIEFVATAGPGGGTDNLARAVQSIVTKYKLTDQPVVVVNKAGGSRRKAMSTPRHAAGDPHKVIFGTSNAWQQPARLQARLQLHRSHPDCRNGAGRVPAVGEQDRPTRRQATFSRRRPRPSSRWAARSPRTPTRSLTRMIEKAARVKIHLHPFQERRRGGRPTGRRPYRCARQQPDREHLGSGAAGPSARSVPSARSGCRRGRRSPRPKAGRRADLRRAGPRDFAVSSSRGRYGCRARSARSRRHSTSTS